MAYYYDDRNYTPRDRRAPRPMSYADPYDEPRVYSSRYEREVYPRRGSDESIEEVQRDFPPGEEYVYERTSRRPRRPVYEHVRRASSVGASDPYSDAAYYRSRTRRTRDSDDRRRRSRYSPSSSPSRSPPRNSRRKSLGEQALGALGIGAAAARSRGDRDRDRGRRRSYSHSHRRGRSESSSSRSRSRDRGRGDRGKSQQRIAQAAQAALTAGAIEAFRQRKEPGDWRGAKGKRILTAAVTAGGTDGFVDKDPNKHGTRHIIESTLTGLAANRLMNGSRSQSRGRNGGGRGRSSSGLKGLAASGALAAAGKHIYDHVSRSRSRARGRRDDDSGSDDDKRGSHKRSKSVSDYIEKGIAALGLGGAAGAAGAERDNDRHRERRNRRSARDDSYSDSDGDSDYGRDSRRSRGSRDVGRVRSSGGTNPPPTAPASSSYGADGTRDRARGGNESSSDSCSDLGDSSDEKQARKKMRRDMLLTSGLASVATIHAAHSVYNRYDKRKKRMQQLESGEITAEEARKRKMKANVMDTVGVGLAALGIKGAYGEWKEVHEKRKEKNEFQEKCAERARKREMRRSRSQGAIPSRRRRWPDEIESAHGSNNTLNYRDGNPYSARSTAQISY
ncbi:hypothetical protein N7510_004352 [Penicillium lagena]|uniref:uncharacterized protein n=1 Tax=Penicillium lagena TaxID=94218 RepID=UPI002540254E|nr:uncharacterized protein N7510_004352 [Penicillium lagena]KAJ5620368.1 hypothetical protein N7510_004352 [Penicillium lagena]